MPRLRNEESEQTQYKDGDVVWVKIHNTEIWWPGEVTSSQDFRFVNTSRPPFAVVAFFNEKTFEQVRSPKLICPFQCDHKDQFIQRGTKKAVGLHMKEKFADDVNIAECRLKRQTTASMSTSSSSMDVGYPTSRPDSLIKALLSSSCSNRSSSTRDSIAASSITTTTTATTGNGTGIGGASTLSTATTTTSGQNEPTFRIMDIGGGGSNSNASSQERRSDVTNYDCNLCSFRTNSMSVLLIHRRVHLEQRPSHDGGAGGGGGGGPSSSSAASGSSHTSGHRLALGQHSRAARRANTTNLIDSRPHHYTHHQRSHHQQQQTPQQHSESRNRSIGSAKFLRNSLRCHSRHVSIQVEGVLSDEAQLMVASIAQRTMDSIERVVEPRDTDSSSSPMSFLDHARSSHQVVTHQQQSTQTKTTAAVSASTQLSLRSPRRQRSNQLRATMPAPMPATPDLLAHPGPSPSKQRRLTRSMSRRQQDATTPTGPPIESPALKANLTPPITATPRRSGSRRSTTNNRPRNLLTTITAPTTPQHEPETPPVAPPPPPPAIVVEQLKTRPTTTTSSKTRSRKRTREVSPMQVTASVPPAPPPPPPEPPADGSPMDLEPPEPPPSSCTSSVRTPPMRDNVKSKHVSSPATPAAPLATTPQAYSSPPTQKNLPLKPASLELQMSLLAEWCDDETEEQWPTTTTATTTSTTNGEEEQQQEQEEQQEDKSKQQQQSLEKVNDSEMETKTETDDQSLAKKLSLLAEWQHDDDEQQSKMETTTSTSNGDQEMTTIATKKRIRNIPKKERRNVLTQQQQQQKQQQQQQAHQDGEERNDGNTNGDKEAPDEEEEPAAAGVSKVDANPDAAAVAETTSDEPIVIQDSDASSNESVVFIEAEPRQRGKVAHLAGAGETGTGAGVAAGASAVTTSSQQLSPSKGNNNNNTSACCFDFEDEDEDEIEEQRRLQQQLLDGQNGGLSYRNASANVNANKRPDNKQTATEMSPAEPPDDLFKGFEEDLERAANAAEAEAESALDQQPHKEEEQPQRQQQPLNLPIKERQKRIFKSRNKSQLATTPSKEEEQEREPAPNTEHEQKDEQEEGQEQEQEQEHEKGHDASSFSHNVLQNRQSTTNGKNFIVYSNGDEGETEAAAAADITEAEAGDSNSRSSKSKTDEHPKSKSKSKGGINKGKGKGKSKNNKSKGGKGKSKVKAKTKLKLKSPPPPLPPMPAATIFSTPTPTPEAEELSNNNSNSSSTSNCSGIISPVLSYSTSCSVASNIAVISPEEARELQRSASDAGLDPTNIVDATQPMQRGGVLILEDIRLPNLYQPAAVQTSTDSNDSSKQQLHQQQQQLQQQHPQQMEDEEEEETTTTTTATATTSTSTEADAEQNMEFETEEEDQPQQQERTVIPIVATASTSKSSVAQYAVPQPREGLLKKREQELLRRYRADMVSGRSAEMCRRVRERWSRSSQKSNEDDDDTASASPPSPTKRGPNLPGEDYQQEMANIELYPQDCIKQRNIKSLPVPPTSPTSMMMMTSQTCQIITPRKSCGTLNMCDKDVAIAHQQLVDLRQRRLQQQPSPATTIQQQQEQPSTRRQRRRSRHASNESSNSPGGAASEDATGAEEITTASTTTTSTVGDSTSQKDQQDGIENPPQLCAGRICAVTTRPIPGYSHTFMLCSLANNNFTPINNVALYLDSEKNHLVPVPSEALTEPPRLADGHPLSAVFADIDFLGGDAVAQVMEQQPIHQLIEVDLDGSAGSAEAVAAVENDQQQQQQVEILEGIMSPMSQVNEVVGVGFDGGEDEDLSLHDEQMHANILQLNVNGHRLELEPSMLFSIAEQPDSCIEVNVAETGGDSGNSSAGDVGGEGGVGGGSSNGGSSSICGRAVLHARDILRAAQVYLQERDLQLVNVEDLTLDEDEVSGAAVPATDLLAEALAHSEVVDDSAYAVVDESSNAGIGLLHIDTRTALAGGGGGGGDEIEGVDQEVVVSGAAGGGIAYITHTLPPPPPPSTAHLTPPITARTNETNALLDQTPIMSALESPSTARSVQLRRVVSPLTAGNTLDDSLAVIGVTNVSATGVPTSLELPITVTNPAIAPARVSVAATTPNVANVNDLVQVQFSPFQ